MRRPNRGSPPVPLLPPMAWVVLPLARTTLAVVLSCGERGRTMRYYLVADDGDVILESMFESYAVQGQLAASGSITTPSPIALDVWRLEAGSHFFQVSTFNQSGEPYVVAELSWPVLSYWKEQINDGTMTLQKLHARHPNVRGGLARRERQRRGARSRAFQRRGSTGPAQGRVDARPELRGVRRARARPLRGHHAGGCTSGVVHGPEGAHRGGHAVKASGRVAGSDRAASSRPGRDATGRGRPSVPVPRHLRRRDRFRPPSPSPFATRPPRISRRSP